MCVCVCACVCFGVSTCLCRNRMCVVVFMNVTCVTLNFRNPETDT